MYKLNKIKKAGKFIDKAIAIDGGNDKDILLHCAEIHETLKEYDTAVECYEKALPFTEEEEKEKLEMHIIMLKEKKK